jgi:hypothetical protein
MPPLCHAAKEGHTEVVKHLLDLGVDPNAAKGWNSVTALMLAAVQRSCEAEVQRQGQGEDCHEGKDKDECVGCESSASSASAN